jgi:hypothetical protein
MVSEVFSRKEMDEMAKSFGYPDFETYSNLDTDLAPEPSSGDIKHSRESLLQGVPKLTLNDDQKRLFASMKNNIIHVPGRKNGEYMSKVNTPTLEDKFPGITDFAITYRLFVDKERGEPEYTAQDIVELIDEKFGYRPAVSWIYRNTSPSLTKEE